MKKNFLFVSATFLLISSSVLTAKTGYLVCTGDVPTHALMDLNKGLVDSEHVKNCTDCYKEGLAEEAAGKKPTNTNFMNSLRRGRFVDSKLDAHLEEKTGVALDSRKKYK